MKKSVKLIILGLILVLLIVAYVLVIKNNASDESTDDETQEVQETVLKTENEDDICKITIKIGEDEYSFVKNDSKWIYNDEDEYPLNQTMIEGMVSALASVSYTTKIEDNSDLSSYGLDEPDIEIWYSTVDESETTYQIGDVNSYNDNYYFYTTIDDVVRMVNSDFVGTFNITISSITNYDDAPTIDTTSITSIVLDSTTYTSVEETSTDSDGNETTETVWKDGSSRDESEITEEAENIAEEFCYLSYTDLAGYSLDTEEELSKFNLGEKERHTVTINYQVTSNDTTEEDEESEDSSSSTSVTKTATNATFYVAVSDDGEEVYIMPEGSTKAYSFDPESFQTFIKTIE